MTRRGRVTLLAIVLLGGLVLCQAEAIRMPLTSGGDVALRRAGRSVIVSVKGPRAGLASLCIGDQSRVQILHASAAIAEATYEKNGERWVLKSSFDWKLRDTPDTGGSSEAQVRRFFVSHGWVANASRVGLPERDFTIRLTDRTRFPGVTFLSSDEPLAMSHWPTSMDDDCLSLKIARGFLPEAAHFRPAGWHHFEWAFSRRLNPMTRPV